MRIFIVLDTLVVDLRVQPQFEVLGHGEGLENVSVLTKIEVQGCVFVCACVHASGNICLPLICF